MEWKFYLKKNQFLSMQNLIIVFYKPYNDILEVFINSKKLNEIENVIIGNENCTDFNSKNDCSKITFEKFSFENIQNFYLINIKYIHTKGNSYIFSYARSNDGNIFSFNQSNSFGCQGINKEYKFQIE